MDNNNTNTNTNTNTSVHSLLQQGCSMYTLLEDDRQRVKSVGVPVPLNERRRLDVLRQTGLLDSDGQDPQYDRFTSMAKRIFNQPMSAISLVDVDRVYFKSKTFDFSSEVHRNHSICSYAVVDDTPDVLVVPNLTEDDRFRNMPIGQSGIKFYAGAVLFLDGFKIGSLCILGPEANYNFDMNARMTLLDLAATLSYVMEQRRLQNITRNSVMTSLTHNLRTPLSSLGMQLPYLEKELLENRDVTAVMQDLHQSFRRLQRTVETNIVMSKLSNALETGRIQKEEVDMDHLEVVLKKLIYDLRDEVKISMNIDTVFQSFSGYAHISYPKIIEFLILSTIMQYSTQTDKLAINISYNDLKLPVNGIGAEGCIEIQIDFTVNKEFCVKSNSDQSLEGENILKRVYGTSDYTVIDNKSTILMKLPCIQEGKMKRESMRDDNSRDRFVEALPAPAPITTNRSLGSSEVKDGANSERVLKVLVVEDSVPLLKTIARWLRSAECDVTTAENGKLGLMHLTDEGEVFDLVIFDFLMPVMNGLEMMQEYKSYRDKNSDSNSNSNSNRRSFPLMIGSSATPPTNDANLLKECGMHLFMPKPINWSKLSKILGLLRGQDGNTEVSNAIIVMSSEGLNSIGSSLSMNY